MKKERRTWTKKNISIILIVGFAYGIWFNFIDSAAYCNNLLIDLIGENCIPVGSLLKNNMSYQTWNIIGHLIPGMFLFLFMPRKIELCIVGALVSSIIMDSPLWGIVRLAQDLPLWTFNFVPTYNLWEWISFYYDPLGTYQVWKDSWPVNGQPTSAVIFWSLIARIVVSFLLILWENKQDTERNRFTT